MSVWHLPKILERCHGKTILSWSVITLHFKDCFFISCSLNFLFGQSPCSSPTFSNSRLSKLKINCVTSSILRKKQPITLIPLHFQLNIEILFDPGYNSVRYLMNWSDSIEESNAAVTLFQPSRQEIDFNWRRRESSIFPVVDYEITAAYLSYICVLLYFLC